jgi:hypothetical protein
MLASSSVELSRQLVLAPADLNASTPSTQRITDRPPLMGAIVLVILTRS